MYMPALPTVFTNKQFQNLAISHFNTTLSINLLVPILPVFLAGRGFAETEIGLIIGAAAVSALFVRPWVGIQVDTRGSRPVLMVGQILLLVSIIGLLWSEGIIAFIILRLAYGVAQAFYGTGAVTFASGIGTGKTTVNAISLYTLITMIGLGLSMSLAQVIFDNWGFTAIVLMTAVLIGIGFFVMKFRARTFEVTGSKDGNVSFMSVLKAKAVLATSVGQFGTSFAFGAVFTFIPLAAIQSGISFYSLFFIAFAVSVISSRFLVQRIIEWFGLEKACMYAYLAMLLGGMLLLLTLSPVVLVVSGLIFGAGFGVTYPAFVLLLVHRIGAANRGTSLGILIASGDIGNAVSISILGGIAEHFGYFYLFLAVTVVLAVCMYLLHSLISRHHTKPQKMSHA
jgi:MFS family permease